MHSPTELQQIIENEIFKLAYPSKPADLYDPIKYIMSLGGKRIRPVVVLMATELFTDEPLKAIDVALAIETFHNFTLVHDDIMDNAPLRRGKQTVHEKWSVNNAILSGDVMMVESNKHLSKVDISVLKPVLDTFNQTAQGVCEGQQLDMEFETRDNVSIPEYIEMIRLKTAVLLGGAMKLGAIVGGADEKNADLLYQFGENLGVAFQLQDDILDVYGDPEKFGKQVGGDIISNKKTFLHLTAKALVQPEELPTLLGDHENTEIKVKAVTQLYDSYQVKEQANVEMEKYLNKAYQALYQIAVSEDRKNLLRQLAKQIMDRES
ncbi:polyprenyl synthetase family protein [Pedobacter chitinilyticus]|uniref:Polyprenyl synthetase family protein n=1 Tax=Pedobacter chitinilyticus TaxID=2233776 RepID=A0A443YM39_9SPHI|nr:polyprenyl synthetase family protein [Pedobacter chitinilyticus]RWU04806.1 polyprenyl synthetase family protein [Pedobacter chitinilyticus]